MVAFRLSMGIQTLVPPWLAAHQTYLDDSLWYFQGPLRERNRALAMVLFTMEATGPTFNVKFMEDNQATITILTNGQSTQMRHTDRTQRVSFGWLKQQFESNQFDLINVNTNYQAADILTLD